MVDSRIVPRLVIGLVSTWAFGLGAHADNPQLEGFLENYCYECHSSGEAQGGLALDELVVADIPQHAKQWETVVRKLSARQMPPIGGSRPEEAEYTGTISRLTTALDRHSLEHPNPGRTETFRRLNRTEYRNAIRDLLDLDVDVSELLPADEASHGFDNITVTSLSPVLLDRYVSAAQKVSRLAVGDRAEAEAESTYRLRPDLTQDAHLPGTPLGARGGTVIDHNFPQSGEYEVQVWLMRDRNEEVEGLRGSHQLEVSLDRERLELFTIAPPPDDESDKSVDANLKTRVTVEAGAAHGGRLFSEAVVIAARISPAATECAFQLLSSPANRTGGLSGDGSWPL